MKPKAQLRKEGKMLTKFRWGETFLVSAFFLRKKDGIYKLSIKHKGKIKTYKSMDRMELLENIPRYIQDKLAFE